MRDRRRGYDAFASFDFGRIFSTSACGPRDHVHRDQLADAPRGGGAGVGRGLHRADVAAHHHRDVARADVFLADQHDVGGLDHGVGRFDRADETLWFRPFRALRASSVLVERLHASILQYLGQLQYHSRARTFVISVVDNPPCADAFVFRCTPRRPSRHWPSRFPAAAKTANEPPVATPSLTLNHDKVPIGSPVKLTYKFDVAAERDVRRRLLGLRARARSERRAAVDRRPPAVAADLDVEAGSDHRVHADGVRAELPVHRRGGRPAGPLQPGHRQAPDAERAGGVPQGIPRREVPAAAAVREHLPDLQGRLASGGSGAGQRRRPSGSGPRRPPAISFRNPKKDATFYLEYDARTDLFNPPQQVTVRLGDQPVGDLRGRQPRTGSC